MASSFKDVVNKASMAVIVSGFIAIAGTIYAVVKGDTEMIKFIIPFALGFLFGAKEKSQG